MPLEPKQQRFVLEYLKDLNATQAAIRAGYSERSAKMQGSRLMTKDAVLAQIQASLQKSTTTAHLTIEKVDQALARVAFADIRTLYDENGNLLPVKQWPDDIAMAVSSLEMLDNKANKVRLAPRETALMLASRRLGMLRDKAELREDLNLEQLVMASMNVTVNVQINNGAQQNGSAETQANGHAKTIEAPKRGR